MAISAWRKKPHTQLITILDMIFVVLVLALHSYNFAVESRRNLEVLRGLIDINEHWGIYVLVWVSAYIVNFIQFFIAFSLFRSLQPDYPDSHGVEIIISRAERWLRFSSFIFLCLIIKFLMYMTYLLLHGRVDAPTLLVVLADILFRMITVYMVKRFVDDLKTEYPAPPPSVFFIKLFSKKSPGYNPNSNVNA